MGRFFSLMTLLCPLLALAAVQSKPFELRDGDRVVFLGDTLMEREKDFGYIELMMTLRFPERNVTFRNLGWSADTPVGISRVSFDWPKGEGEMFRVLMEQVRQVRPSVVVLGYGMANSLEDAAASEMEGQALKHGTLQRPGYTMNGTPRLAKFVTDYNKLIDAILELNKETRFVLLSPIRHEKLPPPLPDPARHNQFLASYTKAIEGVAEKRGYHFVDLTTLFNADGTVSTKLKPSEIANITTKPVHLTDDGIHLNGLGYLIAATKITDDLGWLKDWKYPDFARREELRQVILAKNQLFFHRWRPENSTYLFLFRKHEQGKNAQEIPLFDPLIQAEEEKIAKLRGEPESGAPRPFLSTTLPKPKQSALPEKPATPFKPQAPVHFQLADTNLEVTLWAENPLLAKPIAMNWDARGRLWIASSSLYPQIEPGQAQDDKILILEDTNGDGTADKTTVFADGLLIPTGVEPGDGGCYVGQSTELLHFKDTDGDGIADQKRVVLSGFGTEDTHHILHTLRWGPDGQLYMNQSIYIHSHIETPHGVVRLNSGGTLALRPDTMELGITMKGLVNGWGHAWDDFGQEFQTDGAGGAPPNGLFWNIPQAMFTTYEGARRILGSISPGSYPKFCGLELIKSERFPKEWQGNAVTLDFRANRVVRFEILEDGAGYTTKHHEFLRSTNITFRPIDVKLGPDGALYIADWSNPIIQHGEVDFRDPRRDRVHGRIWRVSYKGGKDVKAVELVKASNDELFAQILSANAFKEQQARRLLIERWQNQDEHQNLSRFIPLFAGFREEQLRSGEAGRIGLRLLWLHQALDQTEGNRNFLEALAENEDARIRAAAVRVLGAWAGNTPGFPNLRQPRFEPAAAVNILTRRVSDSDPRVQVEVLRALARIPTTRAAEWSLNVLDQGELDGFLEYALWLTINDLAEPWAAAVESGAWKIEGREKQLQYALKAIEPKLATKLMAKVIGDQPLPRDGSGGMIELIGQAGGPEQLRKLFDQALNGGFSEPATVRALNQLAEAARLRNVKPSGNVAAVTNLLQLNLPEYAALRAIETDAVKMAASRLVGTWKILQAARVLIDISTDRAWPVEVRQAAIEGLRDLGRADCITALQSLTRSKEPELQRSAAAALASADLNGSMPQIIGVLSGITKEDDALSLWRSLLAAKNSAGAFATALGKTNLPEVVAKAGVRVAREGGRQEPNFVLALNKAGGLSDATAALTDEEIHSIAYNVTKGDSANGERIYRSKQLGCVVCHSIGGAGGKVGPDMTSLGASTPVVDYIVESVLLPNKKVKEGYNSIQITTKDDEDISGNLVREDGEQVILRDATAKEVSVPKRSIASRKMGGSLMPSGLVDFISPQERLDLYAFLAQLGKPGSFDATKLNVARVWRVNPRITAVHEKGLDKVNLVERDWTPIYATVSGNVPKDDVVTELNGYTGMFLAAARFQTAKAGPVQLTISGTDSPKAWIDGNPVGGSRTLTANLPAGTHTFLIRLSTVDMTGALRLESNDATFLVE